MPIYEYECSKCGVFEVNQRITDDPVRKCPTCRSKVKKLISSTSFQLKGSGWYVTDYARKDAGSQGGEKGKESKDSKKGDTSAAESKAADTGGKADSGGKKDGSKTTSAAA